MDNLTAVLFAPDNLQLVQRPVPEIKSDGKMSWDVVLSIFVLSHSPYFIEVLLEMSCVGICGSDVHYYAHGRCGPFVVEKPMAMGHEAAGVVVKIGDSVKNLQVGDRVAIEPGVPCRLCAKCKTGRYNLCSDMKFCATPPYDGNLTRFYAHPADFCFKLPDHVSMEEGALLEPLSVGVHACKRGGVGVDSKVLILGAGPIGLVTLLTAKAMGASKILITDLVEDRLKFAKELGATYTVQVNRDMKETDLLELIHKTMGEEPTITIDCSGVESTTRMAVLATAIGGCVVIVGMGPVEIKIPLGHAICREVDIRGVFRYCNE